MYSYSLDEDYQNDLKRLQSTGKYRLSHHWSLEKAHQITAMNCMNSVQSHAVLAATSDRQCHLLEAVHGTVLASVESPHDRSIHCIAVPCPSVHVSLPVAAYNVPL
jgi:hypothetical protein